jgi:predicted nucleic acid-binding Zn ribbon protein
MRLKRTTAAFCRRGRGEKDMRYKKKVLSPRECEFCKKPFTPTQLRNLYCSERCARKAKKQRAKEREAKRGDGAENDTAAVAAKERTCPFCKEVFVGTKKYCSENCRLLDAKEKRERARLIKREKPDSRISWNLDFCPYRNGMVKMEGERLPDMALGF